ncbi:GNAT family N-acetyltransferase [Pontibacter sp. BT731]|uniref:GNAT family N-acetyltransferase n=1 Tax=Pontibacter coccineus TaxID=3063328 RepID=UPI0026E38462|nr:GNAT family N-acetyltransferase [Pontibacter sp. BT731]MDO6389969.1 GNAT family N-acetyltransferase [Pontibacter sp. BT731]
MAVTLRQIIEQDAAAIARLSGQLGYSSSVADTAQRLKAVVASKDHCGYAAILDEQLVGWIHGCYTLRLESDAFVEIGGLVVDEHYRGKGIGKALIDEVKRWAREKGVSRIRVRCHRKRTDTHTFYRHIGFVETKEQKVFDTSL